VRNSHVALIGLLNRTRVLPCPVPTEELDLMGLAVDGPRNAVDKVLKGTRMRT
jgi:hypothetical protein